MTNNINPWSDIKPLSKRRIDSANKHDIYWFVNHDGKMGFLIEFNCVFNFDNAINLKGILVTKRKTEQNVGQYILILHNIVEWQLFEVLCRDLVATSKQYSSEDEMIIKIELRMKKWQKMLQMNVDLGLSKERQMGLFTELSFLHDKIAKKVSIKNAIESWTGADYDKQDFVINETAIEIKSHLATKGNQISISSIDQLCKRTEFLYLAVYSLNISNSGLSCEDIVTKIRTLMNSETFESIQLFEDKLIKYGYFPSPAQCDYLKFEKVQECAYLVKEDFPKIVPKDISPIIRQVQYTVDLDYCTRFLLNFDDIKI